MVIIAAPPVTPLTAAVQAPTLRAALYLRVSRRVQATHGYSLEAQEADGRVLAAELGASVDEAHIYRDGEDRDASGHDWDLPGLNALLDAAKRHAFDVVIVWDPERLARNMAKQLVVEEELGRYGVTLRYVTLRLGDTAEDRLLKNVRSSIAEYEREKIALRTSRGRRAKAERGEYVGLGRIPFGYRAVRVTDTRTQQARIVGLEPDPAPAAIVARVYALARDLSLYAIVARLNAEGVPAPGGRGWRRTTVRTILRNPTYKGQAAYGRYDPTGRPRPTETWITVAVPALVDAATWAAVQAAMATRQRVRRVRRSPETDPYWLRERLRCGHCGGALACIDGPSGARVYRYYTCPRRQPKHAAQNGWAPCVLPPVPAEVLEACTRQRLAVVLADPDYLLAQITAGEAEHAQAAAVWVERRATLEREIAERRCKLGRLVEDRADAERGSETRAALDARIEEHEQVIARLAAEAAKLVPTTLPGLAPEQGEGLRRSAARIARALEEACRAGQGERSRGLQMMALVVGDVAREARGIAGGRAILGDLGLKGSVRWDPEEGVRMGRHRVTVTYEAAIPICDNVQGFTKPLCSSSRSRRSS